MSKKTVKRFREINDYYDDVQQSLEKEIEDYKEEFLEEIKKIEEEKLRNRLEDLFLIVSRAWAIRIFKIFEREMELDREEKNE